MPKVYIRTFGCQMNARDSEIILGLLQAKGYRQTLSVEEADVVIFNTCSVRQQAEHRVWSNLGRLKELVASPKFASPQSCLGKSKRGDRDANLSRGGTRPHKKIIGLVGCMAQNYQAGVFTRNPNVDFVCGPANIYDIAHIVERARRQDRHILAVDRAQRPLLKDASARTGKLKAFVSVMYGCNNFCSYCIVPFVRGREISRPPEQILKEARGLAENGCKEITLLGQNVNSYGRDLGRGINFVRLLKKLDKIHGLKRIRFTTSHPKDASYELFRAMRDLPRVCEHLHLPLQSGSDKILRLMNRGYSVSRYLKLIEQLRKLVPNCSLTTDIIAGFPGETERDFQDTYACLKKIQFDDAFIFKYSARPKTKAAQLKDSVPLSQKRKRNQILLKLQQEIALKVNKKLLDCQVEVLTEGRGRLFAAAGTQGIGLTGKTRSNKTALFGGNNSLISQIVRIRVNKVTTHTLIGESDGKKD